MKKMIEFIIPIKTFASMIFAGFICLYMAAGFLYASVAGADFNYSIPFVFVLQGLAASLVISVLWGVFISDAIIKKMRFSLRHILFELSLLALLTLCLLTFYAIPTDWAKLWLFVAACVAAGVTALSGICEVYFRKTGKRYTEALKLYKNNMPDRN